MVEISIEEYTWGVIRVVYRENLYQCVIHPHHAVRLRELGDGAPPYVFQDEQRKRWTATRTGDSIRFKCRSQQMTVAIEDLDLGRVV